MDGFRDGYTMYDIVFYVCFLKVLHYHTQRRLRSRTATVGRGKSLARLQQWNTNRQFEAIL